MEAYDLEAAVAFWDDIGRLPHSALAEVDCPVRAWWGERDAVLSSLLSPDELGRDLASRGVEYNVVPGLDHTGMLDRLDLILPTIASWLADHPVGIAPPPAVPFPNTRPTAEIGEPKPALTVRPRMCT